MPSGRKHLQTLAPNVRSETLRGVWQIMKTVILLIVVIGVFIATTFSCWRTPFPDYALPIVSATEAQLKGEL